MVTSRNTLLLGLAILVLTPGCGGQKSRPFKTDEEGMPRLEVIHPHRTNLHSQVELLATVEPIERVRLVAQVKGVVPTLSPNLDIGHRVRQGQLLFKLEIPDILAERDNKKALLAQANKALELADKNLIVAEKEIEEADKQMAKFRAEVEARLLQYRREQDLVRMGTTTKIREEEAEYFYKSAMANRDA